MQRYDIKTPRTDREATTIKDYSGYDEVVPAELARELERELKELSSNLVPKVGLSKRERLHHKAQIAFANGDWEGACRLIDVAEKLKRSGRFSYKELRSLVNLQKFRDKILKRVESFLSSNEKRTHEVE